MTSSAYPPSLPMRIARKNRRRSHALRSSFQTQALSPVFERLENRCVMSGVVPVTVGTAVLPTDPTVQVSGNINQPGERDVYQVTIDTQGLLVATVHSPEMGALLSIEDSQGNVLIQSEATSAANPDGRIAQHLPVGTYELSITDMVGAGDFSMSTTFTPALPPGQSISESAGANSVAVADLTGDGKADLIVPDYYYNQILINYGVGDGTFQAPVAIPVGVGPNSVVAADLFGTGHLDLIVADQQSNDITILEGDGHGNFQVSQVLTTDPGPVQVVVGDFSGDGRLDLAVADASSDTVEIFHNQGDGIYGASSSTISIDNPTSLTVANLNDDDRPDLAVTSGETGKLVLLYGLGNDEFSAARASLPIGIGATDVIAAQFSNAGFGESDLAAVSPDTGTISVFHYDGFAYQLTDTLTAGSSPQTLVAADFNGDGKLDLAAANYGSNTVSVFLGNGDATFKPASSVPTGAGPTGLATADFNGDGQADLVTTDTIGLTVSVLINDGNATFISPPRKPPSAGPEDVVTADLTGNGIEDLVVPDVALNAVEIFLGRGDGTFRDPILVPCGSGPEDVAVGDFTGDGIPDLAVVDYYSDTLQIFKGAGDGTFKLIESLATGDGPEFIKTADLDGDGHLDLVVADNLGNDIGLFYGRGDGTFENAVSYPVGIAPGGIAIADLNGDGRPDIAVTDSGSNDVRIFIATGPRNYAVSVSYPAGAQPWSIVAGNFNKNGLPDLVIADGLSSPSSIVVLANNGNGSFAPPVAYGADGSPYILVAGVFTSSGNLDVVVANDITNDLSVLIGRGDGTFEPATRLATGIDPYGLAVGDFNGDGHLDIVDVNYQSSDLTIYMGQGNGSFTGPETIPLVSPDLPTITAYLEGNDVPQVLVADPQAGTISVYNSQGDGTLQLINTIDVGGSPSGMVVGDFNGDGRPDLAVTDASTGQVLILLGLGNGTFQSPIRYNVGKSPQSTVVGDFNRDGILDIAVADTGSNEISVLFGNGDGTFAPPKNYPTGEEPISLVVGNATTSGYLDLATVNRSSSNLTELIGLPGGNFYSVTVNLPGITPTALVPGDFNGDAEPDLAIIDQLAGMIYVSLDITSGSSPLVPISLGIGNYLQTSADLYNNGESDLILANTNTGIVTILAGWSNSTFRSRYTIDTNASIAGISVADMNADGLPDILITEAGTGQVETFISGGNGVFSAPEAAVPLPHPAPLVFSDQSPGVNNIIDVGNSGQVLDRIGIQGAQAEFNAPVNLTLGTGDAVRDYAVVQTGGVPDVALLDTSQPLLFIQSTLDLGSSGRYSIALPGDGNYTRVISGDLFGTGLDDLVVINRTLNELLIYQQTSSGVFRLYGNPISTGSGPTDVTLATLTPGALPDLVVADGSSGTVTVIARSADGGFYTQATLPGGLATAGTIEVSGGLERTSPDEPVGVTAGVFTTSGLEDVVVVDHGTDRISILQGLPSGELAAPSSSLTYSTGLDPIQVVAASLTNDGLLDLIVLNEGSHDISIFLNNGHGGFTIMPRVDAGDNPTSFTVSDVTGNGVPDLVVSNALGDILILAGNGDGTFQPYERADGTVNLAVGDLTGSGQNDFVLTNTSQDLLSVQTSNSSAGFVQGRNNGLLAPGPVAIADMNGDGIPDLIVTNTGGNDVLVYLGLGNGQFAQPQEFFTGTAPVGLTVAKLTSNGLPDLIVANSGSNDVTILLGVDTANGWTMVAGPRLKAGNQPVSTTVADLYGNGEQDILVVNQDSNDITVLRGLGGGFFNDVDPLMLSAGQGPVQAFVGHFSSSVNPGIVILNSQSNDMTFYANVNASPTTISSGGVDPVAGVMGDFTNDGFSDLAVANNGDSRITLFDGGNAGLALTQTILLGASTRPTDLVVSATKGGGIQLFVGAEGDDHAIAVSITTNVILEVIGTAPPSADLSNSSGLSRISGGSSYTTSTSSSAIFEPPGNVAGAQTSESTSAGATGGGSSGAVSLAAAMVTTLTAAAQSLFSPTSRSLVGLLDNLVQLVQGQTAEILPIGKNEMAAVAVLLSTSSMAFLPEEGGGIPQPVPTEDDSPEVESTVLDFATNDPGGLPPSRLDRFVANLGASVVDFSGELNAKPGRVPEFGAEWVWHRHPKDPSAITATFDRSRDIHSAPQLADQPAELAPDAVLALDQSLSSPSVTAEVREMSLLSRITFALASVLVAGLGFLAVKTIDREALLKLIRTRTGSVGREPLPGRVKDGSRVGSTWSSMKSRNVEDLPPWLQNAKSSRPRRSVGDRSFAASQFRKRSQID